METVMLCLNQVGIGGVETAVLNQTIQLIKKNYRVIILARDGIYREKFEEEGAIFIQTEFTVSNKYDLEKIEKIIKIIEEYDVGQVHIHQFDCINTVFPACILKKIPYVAYAHTGITGVYDWFERCYICYKTMFKLYFESAERIIAITEEAKKENIEKYNISSDKYCVIKNSIDFEKFKVEESNIPKKIGNFLIVSRLSNEKFKSIKNSIRIFKKYHDNNSKARLTIVGDGECKEELEKEIKDIKEVVDFLGEQNNMAEIIAKNDVVVALDRCILEAIAMKKIAIISGYDEIKGIVTRKNIEKASNNNFSGKGLDEITVDQLIEELQILESNEIKKIVEENYQYAFDNLNASKNIYIIDKNKNSEVKIKTDDAINAIIELQNLYVNNIEYTDKVYKECKETQKWLEGQIEFRDIEIKNKQKQIEFRDIEIANKQKQIEELNKELEQINKRKRWKFLK